MIFCFYLLIEQQKSQKSVSKTLRLKFKAKAGAKVAWDLQNLVFVGKNYYECQCFRCVSGWAAPWWRRWTLRRCRGRRGRWRRTVLTTWRAWSRPRRWIDQADCVKGENREDVNEEHTDWPVAMIYSCRALQKKPILQNIKKAFTLFAKLETHQCSALLI